MSNMSNDTQLYGTIVEVSTFNVGENATAAASIGATTIGVSDPTTFDELGGRIRINGTVYSYVSINDAAGTITLDASTPLLAAVAADDQVEIYPPRPLKQALVDLGVEEAESALVTVPHALAFNLQVGMREEADREPVLLTERSIGELYMADIQAFATEGMALLGAAVDLNTIVEPGLYFQPSSAEAGAGLNYPIPYAGWLEVFSSGTTHTLMQRYTAYWNGVTTGPSIWARSTSGAWAGSTYLWKPVVDDHGTESTVADIAVAGSGWSFTSANICMFNKNCSLRVAITRTSATPIAIPSNGNMTNTVIGQMVAKYRPGVGFDQGGIVTTSTGPMVTVMIGSDGTLTMTTAQPPSGSIVDNDTFVVAGSYMMA